MDERKELIVNYQNKRNYELLYNLFFFFCKYIPSVKVLPVEGTNLILLYTTPNKCIRIYFDYSKCFKIIMEHKYLENSRILPKIILCFSQFADLTDLKQAITSHIF